jgi:hypothetical protein
VYSSNVFEISDVPEDIQQIEFSAKDLHWSFEQKTIIKKKKKKIII